MKKFFGLMAMALSVFSAASLPGSADAACTASQVLPIRTYLSGTTCWIYFRPAVTTSPAIASNYWYGSVLTTTTTGAAMCEMATDAVTNQTRLTVYGGASACPGSTSIGSIGTITSVIVNP